MAKWTVDQITVVASVVHDQDWRPLRRSDPRLPALARLLSTFPAEDGSGPAVRNVNAVRMKSDDLWSLLPDSGWDQRRGASKGTREVLEAFLDDAPAMQDVAAQLASQYVDRAGLDGLSRELLAPLMTRQSQAARPVTTRSLAMATPGRIDSVTDAEDALTAADLPPTEQPTGHLSSYDECVRVIATILGLPRVRCTESLPPRAFLEAVAEALDVTVSASSLELLVRCAEAAALSGRLEMGIAGSEWPALTALKGLAHGLTVHGPTGDDPVLAQDEVVHADEDLGDDTTTPLVTPDTDHHEDERRRRVVETVAREGQDRFRAALLVAYGGRCAITGTDALEALDAAHVLPYSGLRSSEVDNGLLLRTDVHRLFDRGLLAVDPVSLEVLLSDDLRDSDYGGLAGRRIRLPAHTRDQVARGALARHLSWTGLSGGEQGKRQP